MSGFQVAYIPVGVPTFHLESAQKEFEKSIDLLKNLTDAVVTPEKMLLSGSERIPGYDQSIIDRTPEYNICQCGICE